VFKTIIPKGMFSFQIVSLEWPSEELLPVTALSFPRNEGITHPGKGEAVNPEPWIVFHHSILKGASILRAIRRR
jgi:hypothetical protein